MAAWSTATTPPHLTLPCTPHALRPADRPGVTQRDKIDQLQEEVALTLHSYIRSQQPRPQDQYGGDWALGGSGRERSGHRELRRNTVTSLPPGTQGPRGAALPCRPHRPGTPAAPSAAAPRFSRPFYSVERLSSGRRCTTAFPRLGTPVPSAVQLLQTEAAFQGPRPFSAPGSSP